MLSKLTAFTTRLRQTLGLRLPLKVPINHGGTRAYALTILLMCVALILRMAIAPVEAGLQYVTFFPSVALASIFGGYRAGLLATAIGLVLATTIFTPPYFEFSLAVLHHSLWSNLVFLMDGMVVSFSIEAMHRYRQRFEKEFCEAKASESTVKKLNEYLKREIARREQADKDMEDQEEFFRLIAENVDDFIAVLDLNGRRLYNSPSYARLFGDVEAMKGSDSFAEIHPDDRERVHKIFDKAVQTGVGERTEYRFVLPDGTICHMESSSGLIRNKQGKPQSVVVVSHDVTERKMVEHEINRLAFHDSLTQLPNRRLLDDRLEQAIVACKRDNHYGAVMFLDLDHFKPLNDTYGHKTGDLLLVEVASRLSACVREEDTVARFGGDEFVVVLGELAGTKSECAIQATTVAEKIRVALSASYWLASSARGTTRMITYQNLGVSIGVVLFDKDADADILLKQADKAMYRAKEEGRNRIFIQDAED